MNEYGSEKIFAMAYPWLFPGGIGDVKDFPNERMFAKWGQMLLRFEDARFQKDKFFCFYALNYITRQHNASKSNWFVKDFSKGGPCCLAELKEQISNGNLSFVKHITYMNQQIKGTTPIWHKQQAELYTWINHHVQSGSGPPTFFITLSCAENYWPDVIRLIKERMELAEDPHAEDCFLGSPKLQKILNEYSLVIQEFFQIRVKYWLKTVGAQVFGIKHYWVRYEFAPGRGQIHAHMLCITKNKDIQKLCYKALQKKNGNKLRAKTMAEWAQKRFGLTALATECCDFEKMNQHPCSLRYSESNEASDANELLTACQMHQCSGFCMKPSTDKKE